MRFQPSQHSAYNGPLDYLAAKLKKSGDPGFYADTGGNGWYLDPSLTLILVFAKGGGERKIFAPGTADYDKIYGRVVKNKEPVTKESAGAVAKKSGGKETKTKAAVTKATGLRAELQGKTWNDGQYTYMIDRLGNVTIGTKVFKKGDAKYEAVIANLNNDYNAGKLSEGSAPAPAAVAVAYVPPAAPAAPTTDTSAGGGGGTTELSITEQPWFWPAVIGGTVVAGGTIWYLFLRTPAAPAGATA
jgi:hypothetical protein